MLQINQYFEVEETGVKAESKFSSTNSQRLSSSRMTATGTGSFWLQPEICEIQFRSRACVLYLSLLCAPCIRSVNNGYIEFSQQANKVVYSEHKNKNFHLLCLLWTQRSLCECRKTKLHEIRFNKGYLLHNARDK